MLRRGPLAGLAVMAALALSGLQLSQAHAQTWKKLATKNIDLSRGTDRIDLMSAKGKYRALRIYDNRARIFLKNVRVVYGLGRIHNEDRGINLLPGERTRPINPTETGRFIDRIELSYKRRPNARRDAVLTVWGLQDRKDAGAVRIRDKIKDRIAKLKDKLGGGQPAPATDPNAPPPFDESGTVFFGLKSVGFGVDHDTITVGRDIGKFDKIQLRVKGNDIYLNKMTVVYGNGQNDVIAYDADIRDGDKTRWFKLKGDRFIDRLELEYRSKPDFRGSARVEVYGEFAEGWLGANGSGKAFNKGWVFLGGQSPLFFSIKKGLGYEKDIVQVGRNKGGFRQIRVDVRNRAITLREMTIIYADGTVDIIPVKKKISRGDSYGPIELMGDRHRAIKEIHVRYRSRLFDAGAKSKSYAFVEFWGKH